MIVGLRDCIIIAGFSADVYKLVLTSPPVTNVTIALNTNDQITTDVPTVTFTPSNWNLPQTVTVTAVNDSQLEGNHLGKITHTVTSDDPDYNNIKIYPMMGNISDNYNRGEIFRLSPHCLTAVSVGMISSMEVREPIGLMVMMEITFYQVSFWQYCRE